MIQAIQKNNFSKPSTKFPETTNANSELYTNPDGTKIQRVLYDPLNPQHQYQILDILGVGSFGKCYRVKQISSKSQEEWACKVLEKTNITTPKIKERLQFEVSIVQSLPKHPRIAYGHKVFQDQYRIYIIMELCSKKTMETLIRARKRLTEFEARYFFTQVVEGIMELHRRRIIHRDIKLANILLNKKNQIKIGDFGLSALLEKREDRKTSFLGTLNYLSPEVVQRGKKGHSFGVDVWALGVFLYVILVGKTPFAPKQKPAKPEHYYTEICKGKIEFPPEIKISEEAKDLILHLCQKPEEKRIKTNNIKNHPWIQNHINNTPDTMPDSVFVGPIDPKKWNRATEIHLLEKRRELETFTKANLEKQKIMELRPAYKSLSSNNLIKRAAEHHTDIHDPNDNDLKMGFVPYHPNGLQKPNEISNSQQKRYSGVFDTRSERRTAEIEQKPYANIEKRNNNTTKEMANAIANELRNNYKLYHSASNVELTQPLTSKIKNPNEYFINRNETTNSNEPDRNGIQNTNDTTNTESNGKNIRNVTSRIADMGREIAATLNSNNSPTRKSNLKDSANNSINNSNENVNNIVPIVKSIPNLVQSIKSSSSINDDTPKDYKPTKINTLHYKHEENSNKIETTQKENYKNASIEEQPQIPSGDQNDPVVIEAGLDKKKQDVNSLFKVWQAKLEVLSHRFVFYMKDSAQTQNSKPIGEKTEKQTLGEVEQPIHLVRFVRVPKYGLGYELSNGTFGVSFRDKTSLLCTKGNNSLLIIMTNKSRVEIKQLPQMSQIKGLDQKLALYSQFRCAVDEQPLTKHAMKRLPVTTSESRTTHVFVTKYLSATNVSMYRISNGTIQVCFKDGSQLLLFDENKVTFTDKAASTITFDIHDPTSKIFGSTQFSHSELANRINYTAKILEAAS
ncbi:hypothetical protein BB558_004723 [Smittium angustum]|uniref:Serine/threonine-protein kinase n=1 Tax=Smittium angustum TaxID=133377 RepID=A0A2U1J2F5_SMIAN|nr:hypothetical protein BB558_004723 [Smittium angustum]